MKENDEYNIRKVWFFFLLTFVYSWLLWLPFVLSGFGVIHLSESVAALMTPAVMLGAFGPLISALILIVYEDGWSGVTRFFRKTLNLRVKPIYYVLAFLIPVLITALAHYSVNFTGVDTLPANLFPEDLPVPVFLLVVPYFFFILIAGGGQEEFGWRGYALEILQQHIGILRGSILIGLIWGVWHLPLWFMPGEGHTYYSFLAFLIYTVSMSVIIGWMYNASDKKMIIAWIMHGISNVAVPFFPILHLANVPQPGYWIWVGLHVLVAIGMTLYFVRKANKYHNLEEAA
jgi:hypothetical protein